MDGVFDSILLMQPPQKLAGRLVAFAIAILLFLLVLPLCPPVCYDRAFVCENTGARMGYRDWFFGLKTRQWHKDSALEDFMRKNFPAELQNRWTSYMGDGVGILGFKTVRSHGHPGPIFHLDIKYLDRYVEGLSDTDKRALYTLFCKGSEQAIDAKMDQISQSLFK